MKIKASEIDTAIAVEVYGYKVVEVKIASYMGGGPRTFIYVDDSDGNFMAHLTHGNPLVSCLRPSTDLNHAKEAAEKQMCNEHKEHEDCYAFDIELLVGMTEVEHICVGTGFHVRVDHASPAMALCLAVLSAVRGETVELEES